MLLMSVGAHSADGPAVVVFGDSLSAGYGIDVDQSWPALLQFRLASAGYEHRVVNASISGETTEGGVTRIRTTLEKFTPDLIILELGGNDGLRGFPADRMRGNLRKIIEAAQASGTAIVTGGPGVDAYLFGRSQVTITRIDDTVLVDGDNNPLYRTIEVAGGAHAVYFSYRHSALCVTGSSCAMSLLRERKLALDAKAGHLYRVGATYRRGRFWAWITDESDEGAVVSGNLPGGADWAADVRGFGGGQVF